MSYEETILIFMIKKETVQKKFFFINVVVRASLCVPWLSSQALKLTTM
jgi:hypothetical protein